MRLPVREPSDYRRADAYAGIGDGSVDGDDEVGIGRVADEV